MSTVASALGYEMVVAATFCHKSASLQVPVSFHFKNVLKKSYMIGFKCLNKLIFSSIV